MDRYRLKNVIILILVLLNACLLAILLSWQHAARSAWNTATQQLSILFASDNLTLDPAIIPDSSAPTPLTFSQNESEIREIAAYFLGKGFTHTQQDNGSVSFSNASGAALFHPNGTFDIAGSLAQGDVFAFCRQFCKRFHYSMPDSTLDSSGTGSITVSGLADKLDVANCTVTFSVNRGNLMAVSGSFLSSSVSELPAEQPLLDAPAALSLFQIARQESGAVVSVIHAVEPCYLLQNTAVSTMALIPAWRITTDTATYYVNSITGELTTF